MPLDERVIEGLEFAEVLHAAGEGQPAVQPQVQVHGALEAHLVEVVQHPQLQLRGVGIVLRDQGLAKEVEAGGHARARRDGHRTAVDRPHRGPAAQLDHHRRERLRGGKAAHRLDRPGRGGAVELADPQRLVPGVDRVARQHRGLPHGPPVGPQPGQRHETVEQLQPQPVPGLEQGQGLAVTGGDEGRAGLDVHGGPQQVHAAAVENLSVDEGRSGEHQKVRHPHGVVEVAEGAVHPQHQLGPPGRPADGGRGHLAGQHRGGPEDRAGAIHGHAVPHQAAPRHVHRGDLDAVARLTAGLHQPVQPRGQQPGLQPVPAHRVGAEADPHGLAGGQPEQLVAAAVRPQLAVHGLHLQATPGNGHQRGLAGLHRRGDRHPPGQRTRAHQQLVGPRLQHDAPAGALHRHLPVALLHQHRRLGIGGGERRDEQRAHAPGDHRLVGGQLRAGACSVPAVGIRGPGGSRVCQDHARGHGTI